MPQANVNGLKLYYVEAGSGVPVVFVHEFAGDYRSWEPQTRYFSRRYRCIAYNARGYPPSLVPEQPEAYSESQMRDDLLGLLNALDLAEAHLVGLSMGSFTVLQLALLQPDRVRSMVLAGTGYGALAAERQAFREQALAMADRIDAEGIASVTNDYVLTPARLPLQRKDPRGWQEFTTALAHHSSTGSALTLRGFQARRSGFDELTQLLTELDVPALIIAGDEDTPSLHGSLYLKQHLSAAALCLLPNTGHTVNLEEPHRFNDLVQDFFSTVDAGRWEVRDLKHRKDMRIC